MIPGLTYVPYTLSFIYPETKSCGQAFNAFAGNVVIWYKPLAAAVTRTIPLIVIDEVSYDWFWDDVSDVLSIFMLQALEGNANALTTAVEGGTTTVTAVDLQAQRHTQHMSRSG